MNTRLIGLVLLSLLGFAAPWLQAADRPNIVWIVSEDNSIHYLRHFIPGGAEAPHIEALAAHGLTFDHAFSNAPVCSVARTTLITGCYAPRIGTQFHRPYRKVPLPHGISMFPAYLRRAGYYTTNNAKKDYNAVEPPGVWDESSRRADWRNRPDKNQPFFHFESHPRSHESSLHFSRHQYASEKTRHDPAAVRLADYHPDTPLFRYTHARYLDRMQDIDQIVGRTVARLEEDGLLEDTFIFYFGDHGGVLPRSKGYLYESGLHVPLVVRVPENFKHLVDAELGSRVDGFVSFVDFGPTVLKLAGIEVPAAIDGRPFLGKGVALADVNARNESFGYADRFDEKYDLVRSLRVGRYQYLRCFQPYLPDGLNNNYRYKMLAYQEWRTLFQAGKLEGPSRQFFQPKPVEMLFDCQADPHQVHNLAGDPRHSETLQRMRKRLHEIMLKLPDLSFYPESYLVNHAMDDPVGFGRNHREEIAVLAEIADLALQPFHQSRLALERALRSDKAIERYWAATVCASFGEQARSLVPVARVLLEDPAGMVRIRAAEFLGRIGAADPRPVLIELINTTDDPVLATEALNSVVWLRDFFGDRYQVSRDQFHPVATRADVMDRLNYLAGQPYPPKKAGKRTKKRRQDVKREPSGWRVIFNGKDLSDWDGDPRLWSVRDGAIRGETTVENPAKGNTFLIWKGGQTKDFELELDFRCTHQNNSGIQYRSSHIEKGPRVRNAWVVRGYQHEIRNENVLPSVAGFIYEEGGKRGRMALVGDKTVWTKQGDKRITGKLITDDEYKELFRLNDWNHVRIVAKGSHLQHYLNGRLIVDCIDEHPTLARREGVLALQLHAGKPMWVEFKEIRIRPLNR